MQSYRKTASGRCWNFSMLSSQASGVISGVQTVENGPIQWSRELPHSCLLSQGEKQSHKIVIPSYPIFVLWISFSHVASTRYQETSHANLSWSAWSQPSEDVDLWEVLQRGEADKDNPSYHCCEVTHMDIGTSGDQPAGEEEGLCLLHEQVEPAACLPRQIPSKLLILNLYPPYKWFS